MKDNCSTEYDIYLHGQPRSDFKQWLNDYVTNCILDNASETMKMNMQAAAVLLGLTPTILSLVGSSTAETSILALRRPVLAFLLGAGSPSVNPLRSFEYWDPVRGILKRHEEHNDSGSMHPGTRARVTISILEYLVALAAVANVTELAWRLGVQTICAFSADSTYEQFIWTYIAILIHLGGCMALRLRVEDNVTMTKKTLPFQQRFLERIKIELSLSRRQPALQLIWKHESPLFTFLSWCVSTGTVLHIVYGTLVFSSILFISTQDSVTVVARYFGSALICRIVLVYELSGMRTTSSGAG